MAHYEQPYLNRRCLQIQLFTFFFLVLYALIQFWSDLNRLYLAPLLRYWVISETDAASEPSGSMRLALANG